MTDIIEEIINRSCVTAKNNGCIFENLCPDYNGKPSKSNKSCLTLSKNELDESTKVIIDFDEKAREYYGR